MNRRPHRAGFRLLGLLLGAALALEPRASPAAPANNSIPGRVIRAYALTSANDFPERDPQDWRLLGSNDGGQTWSVVDVRRSKIFSERQQRRLFTCANPAAFRLYRLQIDRVRAPAAATAVQLAEIEPLDDNSNAPSPAPLFCDNIEAQGANPPTETPGQAFDGRATTKWLDFAAAHRETRASWIQWRYADPRDILVTNLADLNALRARAAENFPVRVRAVIVGVEADGRQFWLRDDAGSFRATLPSPQRDLIPGTEVELSGASVWDRTRVGVREAALRALAAPRDAAPWRIELEQPIAEAEENRWVEMTGNASFVTETAGTLSFDLTNIGRRVFVRALDPAARLSPPAEGARLRVRGLCGGVFDPHGQRVAGLLWIPDLDSVSLVDSTNTPVETARSKPPPAAAPGGPLTDVEQIRRLDWSSLPIAPSDPNTAADYSWAPRVRLRGVVTEAAGGCMQDSTGGIEIWTRSDMQNDVQGLGAFIEVEGRCILAYGHGASGLGPVVQVESLRRLGEGALPEPVRPSWSALSSGQMDAQWVEVDAVLRATDGSHMLLACENGQLAATIREAPIEAVTNLLDASLRLRGVSIAATDRGQMQGTELLVPSLQFVQILQVPTPPASLPIRHIADLTHLRSPRESLHRVKVAGIVTCIDHGRYTVQDATGGALAIAKENVILHLPAGGWWTFWQSPQTNPPDLSLRAGDSVNIVGFPETRGYAPVLTEATFQKVTPLPAIQPAKATADSLSRGELDSTLVSIEGVVQGNEKLDNFLVMQMQSGLRAFRAVLPVGRSSRLRVPEGSRVRLTGVCQIEPSERAELGRHLVDFTLRLRDASDIALLSSPPWLSLRRALLLAAALAGALLAAFFWIRLLHRQVGLRTRQLEDKIAEHEKTETLLAGKTQLLVQEIEERKRVEAEVEKIHKQLLTTSRLAGMADVATNVLHNVGNVLNSVNILATSIASHVKKSRAPSVSKVASLLAEHESDLGRFMTEDPHGRLVPDHLERLGAHLADEQVRLEDKVKSLSESIAHIKEIVATQQNYAKVAGLRETVALADIVEDALRMCSAALARHGVELIRDYEPAPPLTLDRHKTLQILFNLLDNAKHACWRNTGPKRVAVRIRRHSEDRARVEIVDNGQGIAAPDLARIFTQGFSTRKHGHGFGLHSSILAAQDMGGSLTAQSDGPGCGSTFTLELPLALTAPTPKPHNGSTQNGGIGEAAQVNRLLS